MTRPTLRQEWHIDRHFGLMAVTPARFDSLNAYDVAFGPGTHLSGCVQYPDRDLDCWIIVIIDPPHEEPTEASMIAEGVGHAWGQRLAHLTNQQILDAIALGAERALRKDTPCPQP